MEAASLKTNKKINKGKLKKTMKHIICRPDPSFWPQTSDEDSNTITEALNRYKVNIPEFKKPLWNELKNIPKESRPKPPPIPKIEGLIFGLAECHKAIQVKECNGVLIETAVNPKTIVQPLIEICHDNDIPVFCLKELRRITKVNYGIPTSVLGVKKGTLPELETKIIEIYEKHKPPTKQTTFNIADEEISVSTNVEEKIMDTENKPTCPYLYRAHKNTRVFTPTHSGKVTNVSNKFIGQNFIKLPNNSEKQNTNSKEFMKMIVKKISSNPNRRKLTKNSSKE